MMIRRVSFAVALLLAAWPLGVPAHGVSEAVDRLMSNPPDEDKTADELLPASLAAPMRDPARGVVERLKVWKAGSTLRVCFMTGEPAAFKAIAKVADTWSQFANIHFDFGSADTPARCGAGGPFDIKVAFGTGGYWSYVGTDSRRFTPSMNLEAMDQDGGGVVGAEFNRIVLHEFGHALGFQHEHQSPEAMCDQEIDWDAAAEYYSQCCGWSRTDVENNLKALTNLKRLRVTPYDHKSIMHYSLPVAIFRNGKNSRCHTANNYSLSVGDRSLASAIYPSAVDQQDAARRMLVSELGHVLEQANVPEADQKATLDKVVSHFEVTSVNKAQSGQSGRDTLNVDRIEQRNDGSCGSNFAGVTGTITTNTTCGTAPLR